MNCELCGHPFTFVTVPEQKTMVMMVIELFEKKDILFFSFLLQVAFASILWFFLMLYLTLYEHVTMSTSCMQEYKPYLSIRNFFLDFLRGEVFIFFIAAVCFISIFLIKDLNIKNTPAERLPVAEAPEDFQPVFRDEVIRPDPSVPIFEDLFDGDWGEDNDEQLHNYVNINRGVQSRLGLSPPTADERIRSVSMPPDIRYYRDSSLGDNNYELQRAVSMEPAINTTASTYLPPPFNPQTPSYHGTPPPPSPSSRNTYNFD
ncbi:hypothetical protein BDF21DRAFT_491700 [Thamnidium elegans]|nr:hypothetical protein BDF21DRAFT_491700 [Thamnidium elegans]